VEDVAPLATEKIMCAVKKARHIPVAALMGSTNAPSATTLFWGLSALSCLAQKAVTHQHVLQIRTLG
jgi:hypothetical protein